MLTFGKFDEREFRMSFLKKKLLANKRDDAGPIEVPSWARLYAVLCWCWGDEKRETLLFWPIVLLVVNSQAATSTSQGELSSRRRRPWINV